MTPTPRPADFVRLPALHTERLRLEIPSRAHIEEIFSSFASDPTVTRFLTWPPARTVEDSVTAMVARLTRIEAGEEFSWVLVSEQSGGVVGNLSLLPDTKGLELGFVLARSAWGTGMMVEACRAAIDWAMSTEGPRPPCVSASCAPENPRSARVLEKLGFIELERTFADRLRPNWSPTPGDSRNFELVCDSTARRIPEREGVPE